MFYIYHHKLYSWYHRLYHYLIEKQFLRDIHHYKLSRFNHQDRPHSFLNKQHMHQHHQDNNHQSKQSINFHGKQHNFHHYMLHIHLYYYLLSFQVDKRYNKDYNQDQVHIYHPKVYIHIHIHYKYHHHNPNKGIYIIPYNIICLHH